MQINWYNRAVTDFEDITDYIHAQSPQNAVMVYNTVTELVETLPLFPFKYPKEPTYNHENIRFVVKWSLKIVYRVDTENNKIYILRIFNTHQNPKKLIQ
jgi:plasmid stabilization system protein ParE